jgi:methylenetetrahydrofolate reductase (NADPH)
MKMKLSSLYNKGKTVLSFEVFPPKKTSGIETVYNALDKLADMNPAYISVTYGAGGTEANNTALIASHIKNKLGVEPLAHLTCVNNDKVTVKKELEEFKKEGIENILALRGDIVEGYEPKKDFLHASDLCTYIKARGDFELAGACYPEVHMECATMEDDIKNLKHKVDCGAEHLITQLFFDNNAFYNFMDKVRGAGINVPVAAGIMPVTNSKQIERMVSMCGASLPAKFSRIMQKYEGNPEALRDAGIAYAVEQIVDLISSDVDGIHLYTMNNPYVAGKITEAIGSLL